MDEILIIISSLALKGGPLNIFECELFEALSVMENDIVWDLAWNESLERKLVAQEIWYWGVPYFRL
jgi:hypothetical protein